VSRWKSSSPFFRELDRRCAGPSRLRHEPGALLVVVGGLGIPSIVRVEPDGSWMCVAGTFKGRPIRSDKSVLHVCRDGDVFEDLGLEVRGGELVPVDRGDQSMTSSPEHRDAEALLAQKGDKE